MTPAPSPQPAMHAAHVTNGDKRSTLDRSAIAGDARPKAAGLATSGVIVEPAESDDTGSHRQKKREVITRRESYPGGKAGAGVFQTLINLMPPHETYIEAFLGAGAVMRNKKPARYSIGIDADAEAIEAFPARDHPSLELVRGNAIELLKTWRGTFDAATLIYADPPYLESTRRQSRSIYRYEMKAEHEHVELLDVLLSLPCMVMLSGYYSELYSRMLTGWRVVTYTAMTRGGRKATEHVWLNFPEPLELHDYRYLGRGFRERERIKRKRLRWKAKLERMPALERHALMATIDELRRDLTGEA